jgi:hypothetical protein
MLLVPNIAFYANTLQGGLPITYHQILDEGVVDDETSYVLPRIESTPSFYVAADCTFDGSGVSISYDLSEMNDSHSGMHIVEYAQIPELRTDDDPDIGSANADLYLDGYAVGNTIEIKITPDTLDQYHAHDALPQLVHIAAGAVTVTLLQDLVFSFPETRTFYMMFNDVGTVGARKKATVCYFHTVDCSARFVVTGGNFRAITEIHKMYDGDTGALVNAANDIVTAAIAACLGGHKTSCLLGQLGPNFQRDFLTPSANRVFDGIIEDSRGVGPVFQSQRRISQHLCAPILNPNARIGCTAPLNYETMHLPPEMRDFQLELRDINFSFLPGKISLEPLVLYEFNGGNQQVAAQDNLLHLPQFREFTTTNIATDGSFDMECFSPYGMPSYIAAFARDKDASRDHLPQPLIKQLDIMCNTTMKKSNTILKADVHQLYHITQRNVNQRARYNRFTFNRRQVVLMSAEDIGLMGLLRSEYQNEKRTVFRFRGIVDELCRLTLLIYSNRGLYVDGKQFGVVRLQN